MFGSDGRVLLRALEGHFRRVGFSQQTEDEEEDDGNEQNRGKEQRTASARDGNTRCRWNQFFCGGPNVG